MNSSIFVVDVIQKRVRNSEVEKRVQTNRHWTVQRLQASWRYFIGRECL